MKVGAEDKKKVYLLAGLTVVAAVTVYSQLFGNDAPMQQVNRRAPQPAAAASPQARASRKAPSSRTTSRRQQMRGRFEPIWQALQEDETFDPLEADPTIRTDLLAAVRAVSFEGVERNIFEFTTRKAKVEPGPTQEEKDAAQKILTAAANKPKKATPKPKPKPGPPRAPRLTWKYYGYANEAGAPIRRAFLLDGEHVLIGAEGDVFRDRYKIVRIGLTSVVIEDMQFEAEQTLALEAPKG